jgi:hypothetical protein
MADVLPSIEVKNPELLEQMTLACKERPTEAPLQA